LRRPEWRRSLFHQARDEEKHEQNQMLRASRLLGDCERGEATFSFPMLSFSAISKLGHLM
jgi:hypothetical protein